MRSVSIRNRHCNCKIKPRLFDFVIDDDNTSYIVLKVGKLTHVILMADMVDQIKEAFPDYRFPFFS